MHFPLKQAPAFLRWAVVLGVCLGGICFSSASAQIQFDRVDELVSPNPESRGIFGVATTIGDVNGDDVADVVVGASGEQRAYVISGADRSIIHTLESPFSGNGFGPPGEVGDVDGDGVPDVGIAARGEDVDGLSQAGRAYIFSGEDGTLLQSFQSPSPEGFGRFGAITGVGDVDGDGEPDVAVGAYFESVDEVSQAGRVHLFKGGDGTHIRTLVSPNPESSGFFGFRPAGIVDVNEDGVRDLAVDATEETVDGISGAGRTYVFSGDDGSLLRTLESPNPDSAGQFGVPNAIGDVDDDGVRDLVIEAAGETVDQAEGAGRAYVYSGASGDVIRTLESPNPEADAGFGFAERIGDIDGDGIADIGVGALREDASLPGAGRGYLFSGGTGQLLQTLESSNPAQDGGFGSPLKVDDLNGDGVADLLISAEGESVNGQNAAGRVYVYVSRPSGVVPNSELTFGDPTDASSYQPVALPGSESVVLTEVVSGEPGAEGDYRAYREEGATTDQDYNVRECGVEVEQDCSFQPGRGLWLLSRNGWSPPDTLEKVALNADGTYTISLDSGWNLISNPFAVDLSWFEVGEMNEGEIANQALFNRTQSGTWQEVNVLESATTGMGYYVFNPGGDGNELRLPYPTQGGATPSASSSEAKDSRARGVDAKMVTLGVYSEDQRRSRVALALSSAAKPGLDPMDVEGPPSPFSDVSLRTRVDGSRDEAVQLFRDVRPLQEGGQRFPLHLKGPAGRAVTLRIDSLTIPDRFDILLMNRSTGRAHNISENDRSVLVQADAELSLVIGTASYVQEAQSTVTPEEVRLVGNGPNPFTESTTIEYALPEAQEVRLTVYDVLGRRVTVLVEEFQQAGFHQVQWSPRGATGSGVYFYRLRTDGRTEEGKMTIVR